MKCNACVCNTYWCLISLMDNMAGNMQSLQHMTLSQFNNLAKSFS